MGDHLQSAARRRFLSFLAASPLAASAGVGLRAFAQDDAPYLISSAEEALNVFELQAVAERTIPPAHYGYLAGGVLDDRTIEANRRGYDKWGLRARRLVDISRIDLSIELFGETWNSPVALCPVSSQRAFHAEGEAAVAAASGERGALQILSTLTTTPIEQVIELRERPVWFQLYPTNNLDIAEQLVARADAAGASAIVFTVDLLGGGMRRETEALWARRDDRDCTVCHDRSRGYDFARKSMFSDFDMAGVFTPLNSTLTWDYVDRLREMTDKRVLVKGVMTPEDAELAIGRGVDGIIVSNHGGRSEDSLIGTVDVLPEILQTVNGRIPVLIDGGIRRGADAFKALALGASAVCIGRPYCWGLGAFGRDGAAAAMRLIDEELTQTMRQAGVTRVSDIGPEHVARLG
ncbi:MAG: alpha-hydroxy acid oxidase [Maricaulaceae bacterium]|jgi:isopentenyl diphosphate isomerase/L-lactate dehydrogenase-like FMN-dependent dehydrogenase